MYSETSTSGKQWSLPRLVARPHIAAQVAVSPRGLAAPASIPTASLTGSWTSNVPKIVLLNHQVTRYETQGMWGAVQNKGLSIYQRSKNMLERGPDMAHSLEQLPYKICCNTVYHQRSKSAISCPALLRNMSNAQKHRQGKVHYFQDFAGPGLWYGPQ